MHTRTSKNSVQSKTKTKRTLEARSSFLPLSLLHSSAIIYIAPLIIFAHVDDYFTRYLLLLFWRARFFASRLLFLLIAKKEQRFNNTTKTIPQRAQVLFALCNTIGLSNYSRCASNVYWYRRIEISIRRMLLFTAGSLAFFFNRFVFVHKVHTPSNTSQYQQR